MFEKVIDDVKGFLLLMKEYNTYIGGVEVPDSESDTFSDMELYVQEALGAKALIAWLQFFKREGYESMEVGEDYPLTGAGRVFGFQKSYTYIHLHVVADEPVSHIMKAVCTTFYMHFASWRGIYRLYPRLEESKNAFVFFVKDKYQMKICERHLDDGYSLLTGAETGGFPELQGDRYVGDEMCEFIRFEDVGVCGDDIPRYGFKIENGSMVIMAGEQ